MPNVTRGISTLQHLGVAEGSGRQIHTSAPTSTVAVRGIIDDLHAGGVVIIDEPRADAAPEGSKTDTGWLIGLPSGLHDEHPGQIDVSHIRELEAVVGDVWRGKR